MSGATGAPITIALLTALRRLNVETHLILTKWAESTLRHETDYTPSQLRALADVVHLNHDLASPLSSGSFTVHGMIIAPCSVKTLAAVASGYHDGLVARAADVALKQRRPLVLAVRETPLSGIHIANMATVTQHGAIVFPPVPAFYSRPATIQDIVDHTVGRMLDLFGLDTQAFDRWHGFPKE
ncbi:hypothetical protein CDD81_3399 [Ophiocordyceps australis]|uniref:Flavin prenyltransferase PAD1, mitochondrial n=1 Tax=Ophiocordyceps australis TaxID=1399860 RepID=A0A2C5XS73_9HYPO|nr:hypothetical protein CDD81_3399 [Ophiocordyceps australis]